MRIISERPIKLSGDLMANRTFREHAEHERSPGVHVQAVNATLGVAAGKLEEWDVGGDNSEEKFSATQYPLLPALGVAWEEMRASHYTFAELSAWPGEFELDGLVGTPDGLLMSLEAIWECKLTTKKIQSVADCWMYVRQGLAYCALTGLKRVQYDVLWLLGDYSRPYKPKGTVTLVEYDDREIKSWWKNVLAASKHVKPERA